MSTINDITLVNNFGEQTSNEIVGPITLDGGGKLYSGTGVPSFSATKGAQYNRIDGSGASQVVYVNTATGNNWSAVGGGGGSGANQTLSNLTADSVAANTHITPASDISSGLGTATKRWDASFIAAIKDNTNDMRLDLYDTNRTVLRTPDPTGELNLSVGDGSDPAGFVSVGAGAGIKFVDYNSGFSVGLKASTSITGDSSYALPIADGTSGQVLSTDGAGHTSWVDSGGGDFYSELAATSTHSNSDGVIALTNLNVTVVANTKYQIQYMLHTTSAATVVFDLLNNYPASYTSAVYGPSYAGVSVVAASQTPASGSLVIRAPGSGGGFFSSTLITLTFKNGANAGTIAFRWQSAVSGDSAPMSILAGSYVTAKILAP